MVMRMIFSILVALLIGSLGPFARCVDAAEVKVMISGGFSAAYRELVVEFERSSGHTVVTAQGASMGTAPTSIPNRLERGEPADVLIMVGEALEELTRLGKVVPGTRVDLARSLIGMAVRAGAPRPDIGSVEAFKHAMLAAQSVAYSESASGKYISTELFPRLGIADQMKRKSKTIVGERVAAAVARGEAEIAFQQVSELLPVPGVDFVGPLPAEIQKVTVFAGAIAAGARERGPAGALLRFLTSRAAVPAIVKSALEPMTSP